MFPLSFFVSSFFPFLFSFHVHPTYFFVQANAPDALYHTPLAQNDNLDGDKNPDSIDKTLQIVVVDKILYKRLRLCPSTRRSDASVHRSVSLSVGPWVMLELKVRKQAFMMP